MTYDIVIIGGGHNGLVAACYLAKAGKKVLILEKNDYIGGASTSQKVFPDYDANLSRYAYLVSLFPQKIFSELDVNVNLLRRNIASYTPFFSEKQPKGLIISNIDDERSRISISNLGFGEKEWQGYQTFLQKQQIFAEIIWDSMLDPLRSKNDWENLFKQKGQEEIWGNFVEEPLGKVIEQHVQSDILRGVLLTDGKIGAYTHAHDESLLQNRTFIYHIIGNKTGEWKVPQGGMGNLANQLKMKALQLGVTIKTQAEVNNIHLTADKQTVYFIENGQAFDVKTEYILSNAAPQSLQFIKPSVQNPKFEIENEGTAFKINMLLQKLPQLKDKSISPQEAFAGTFHIDESYSQLQTTFDEASNDKIPTKLAGEIYCHTLTDNSILSPKLQQKGFHTLTYFGMDLPYSLFLNDNEKAKQEVLSKFLAGINEYLDEPLEECLAKDSAGNFCIEGKSSLDLEKELGLPRGNIFHKALAWFYADNDDFTGKWGVETDHEKFLICGSSAIRGGAVSGIGGRNAAMKILGK